MKGLFFGVYRGYWIYWNYRNYRSGVINYNPTTTLTGRIPGPETI